MEASHVPQGCLGRANCLSNAYGTQSTEGARQLNYTNNKTHLKFMVGFLLLNFLYKSIDYLLYFVKRKIDTL